MKAPDKKLHELLMYCIDFSETMLIDSAEFYPFGAVIGSEGEIKAIGAYDGEETPDSKELYKILLESFSTQVANQGLIATALASNVNIPSEYSPEASDGLRVQLETKGYARYIYVPYTIKRKGLFKKTNLIEFLEPFAVEIEAQIFL